MQALSVKRTFVVSAIVTAAVAGSSAIVGCAEPACTVNTDCSLAEVCTDGACVPADIDVPGGGGGGGGGGRGGGGGNGVQRVLVGHDVSTLQPGFGVGDGLVGFYDVGTLDALYGFDPVAGTVDNDPLIDFGQTSVGGGTCNIDTVTRERGISADVDGGDELWFTCSASGLSQAQNADDLANFVVRPTGVDGADLMVRLTRPDDQTREILERRLYAHRGTGTLVIEQVRDAATISPGTARERDRLSGVTFGKIAGLTLVSETDDRTYGDIVLVFDRAYPGAGQKPALVPIERQNTTGDANTWAPAAAPWRVLVLPDDTHAVVVHGDLVSDPDQLTVGGVDRNVVNLEVYLPTHGRVGVGRLETEMTGTGAFDPDASGFSPLEFETGGDVPAEVPSADDRVLLLDAPGVANTVFYVLTNGAYAWRLTLPQSRNDGGDLANAVLRAGFNDDSNDRPSAALAIPGVGDALWLSFSHPRDELHRVTFKNTN